MSHPLLPAPLRTGDRVALVAPSGVVDVDRLQAGTATLRAWGYEPVEMPSIRRRTGHLAGTDAERLSDLQAAIDDPSLRAIWAARGGYGLTRIVDRLDWSGLREVPRWLVGFSDATALHHAAWRRARIVTCHGHFAGRLDQLEAFPDAAAHLRALVAGTAPEGPLPALDGHPPPGALVGGRGTGPLLGGNLAVLCAGIGTSNQLDTAGAVLFLEDVNEPPYKLDRMLTQVRAAGMLDGVVGVVVGTFVGCDPPPGVSSGTVGEVLADRLGDLGVPVLTEWPVGHHGRQLALPHGAMVTLDATVATLSLDGPVTA